MTTTADGVPASNEGAAACPRVATAAVLPGAVALLVLGSFSADEWIDDSWTVLLMAGTLALGYALLRRIFVAVAVAAVVVSVALSVSAPQLSTNGSGTHRVGVRPFALVCSEIPFRHRSRGRGRTSRRPRAGGRSA